MKTLRLATGNAHKLREFREILAPLGVAVRGLDEVGPLEVVEDGATFAENAVKKAAALVQRTGEPAVADDSGLVVDALGGAPGVRSARYAGVSGADQDAANRRKLLDALRGVPEAQRSARFVCALAYCEPGAATHVLQGTLEGRIIASERGEGGFGYDPLFVPEAETRTLAEMSAHEKHAISHRGRALRQLVELLAQHAGSQAP